MQAMNKLAYRQGISRSQRRWLLPKQFKCALTVAGQVKYSQKIFAQDIGGPNSDCKWWQIEDKRLDFSQSQTITIGMSVFAFSET